MFSKSDAAHFEFDECRAASLYAKAQSNWLLIEFQAATSIAMKPFTCKIRYKTTNMILEF